MQEEGDMEDLGYAPQVGHSTVAGELQRLPGRGSMRQL